MERLAAARHSASKMRVNALVASYGGLAQSGDQAARRFLPVGFLPRRGPKNFDAASIQ